MKTAAGIVAVLAWGGFLAAMWYALVVDNRPPLGAWLGVVFISLLVGVVVPAFLLSLEGKPQPPIRPMPKRDE